MPRGQSTDTVRRARVIAWRRNAQVVGSAMPRDQATDDASHRFCEAVLGGNIKRAKEALQDGGRADEPLMLTATLGDADFVDLLLEAGASVTSRSVGGDVEGHTALTQSAVSGNPEIAQRLIDAGARSQSGRLWETPPYTATLARATQQVWDLKYGGWACRVIKQNVSVVLRTVLGSDIPPPCPRGGVIEFIYVAPVAVGSIFHCLSMCAVAWHAPYDTGDPPCRVFCGAKIYTTGEGLFAWRVR